MRDRLLGESKFLVAVRKVSLGYRPTDKLRILAIMMLGWLARRIDRFSFLLELMCGFTKGTVLTLNGLKYSLLDFESYSIVLEFEGFMQPWLNPQKGENCVDIGAHIGKYTLSLAKAVGNDGIVVSVEANPSNYKTLQNNIRLNNLQNVIALNLAAWERECTLKLFTGHFAGHHSAKINWRLGWVEVKAAAMDSIIKGLRLDSVDWIKIDVEGAELEVLRGLKKTISKHKPKIIIEVFSGNMREIKNLMRKFRYNLIRISPSMDCYRFKSKFVYLMCVPDHFPND